MTIFLHQLRPLWKEKVCYKGIQHTQHTLLTNTQPPHPTTNQNLTLSINVIETHGLCISTAGLMTDDALRQQIRIQWIMAIIQGSETG